MNEEESVKLWKKITFILAIVFVLTLIFHTIPNIESSQDKQCQEIMRDKNAYAKEIPMSTLGESEYQCCIKSKVHNYKTNTTKIKEGCSSVVVR